jgi:hypothetical protein
MSYQIDLMEFLSSVAVAAFSCKNRNFYLYCFSFCFQLFSCLAAQLADFNDFIARCFRESLVLEILLFHCPKLNADLAIIIIIDYYLNSFVNCYWSRLKYSMKNHCFTLSLRNREKHQQDVFSYSATRHYHGLLYCLFSESDSIHELLNVQYCCCLYFHLNLIEDENYDIRYCCFVLADTVSLKDSMLRRYFGDFNREFYE